MIARALVVVGLVALVAAVAWWRARRVRALRAPSPAGLPPVPSEHRGDGRTWLVFATRYCATCDPAVAGLRAAHPTDTVRKVLVEDEPELAARFDVRMAPTMLEVGPDGAVRRVLAGADAVLGDLAPVSPPGRSLR